MNAGLNINMVINQLPNNIIINHQGLGKKGDFLNMLTKLLSDNSSINTGTGTGIGTETETDSKANVDAINLLTGSILNTPLDLNNLSYGFKVEDIKTNKVDPEEKIHGENEFNTFMKMAELFNYNLPINYEYNNILPKKDSYNYNANSADKDLIVNNHVLISEAPHSYIQNTIQNTMQNTMQNYNPNNIQQKTKDNTHYYTQDNFQQQTQDNIHIQNNSYNNEHTNFSFKEEPRVNYSPEMLITQTEKSESEVDNEVDFNVGLVHTTQPMIEGQNKKITISDESSEIRSQVLSQLKDKIVFMNEDGLESSNNIKQVTMELHPHDLGKVNIKMIYEDNKITVEIKALNEETHKTISSNVSELADILSKTTESTINIAVKSYDVQAEHKPTNYIQYNEQNYHKDFDQEDAQGRQRNQYYREDSKEEDQEDSIFSELINSKNIKL